MNEGYNEFDGGPRGGSHGFYSPLSRPKSRGMSIVSLVTGILAVICCCLGWTGLIFGAVAIATSIVSRVKLGYFDGLAIAGLVLGIFGFVFGLVTLMLTFFLNEEFWAEFEKAFWEEYNKQFPEGTPPSGGV